MSSNHLVQPGSFSLLLLLFLMPGSAFAVCDLDDAWMDVRTNYPKLDLASLMREWSGSTAASPDHISCVQHGAELLAALQEPECGSILVLDNGVYDPGSRDHFAPWQRTSGGGRTSWTGGSCAPSEPFIVIARHPVIEPPEMSQRGPGDMTTTELFDGDTRPLADSFAGAVLCAPFSLIERAGADYSNIWLVGLQFYGDPRAGRGGDGGFRMNDDKEVSCTNCFLYRNLFRRIYGRWGAVRLYRADGTAIIGNRFVEVGYPGVPGGTDTAYPLALFDSEDLRIGWNLFDGIPLEASEGVVTGQTDTWSGLDAGDLPWRLQGVVSDTKPKNVLYSTYSGTSAEMEREGVCGLDFFRNVIAHSGGVDLKNSLCDPTARTYPRNPIRIFDNSFVNTGQLTMHAGATWVRVDGNDFVGTEGVRVTNSKTGAEGGTRRADHYGYLHDLYVTNNLLVCGSKGFMMRGGERYFDPEVDFDPQRDLYNVVVAANWLLFNDDQPFGVSEDSPHAGVWIEGILGDGVLMLDRFGNKKKEPRRATVDHGLFLCGNVIGANGGESGSPDDPERFAACSEFEAEHRRQIHPTVGRYDVDRDTDVAAGAWGWDASVGEGAMYDANAVVTSMRSGPSGRLRPVRLPGSVRWDELTSRLAGEGGYGPSWRAFCHVGATALYDGPWGSDYGRIGERARPDHKMVAAPAVGTHRAYWSGGATLVHSSTTGACPTPDGPGAPGGLDLSRLGTDFGLCPTTYTAEVGPNWHFAAEELSERAEGHWQDLFGGR